MRTRWTHKQKGGDEHRPHNERQYIVIRRRSGPFRLSAEQWVWGKRLRIRRFAVCEAFLAGSGKHASEKKHMREKASGDRQIVVWTNVGGRTFKGWSGQMRARHQ